MSVAFFAEGSAGPLFCVGALRHAAVTTGRVLLVPPFAEEMNKSRHLLSAILRGLADTGQQVILPDLFGTGDSAGDFGEATLATWRSDLDHAIAQMDAALPLDVVGLRFGTLLAADLVQRHPVRSLTLLQPVSEGRQQLTQMLRLRLAASLTGSAEKETAASLRQRLADGEDLEIAGYCLSGTLAAGIESLSMGQMTLPDIDHIHWLEAAPQTDRPLMPVSRRLVDAWVARGIRVDAEVVACDAFWATQEIADCAPMVAKVLDRLGN